MMKAVTLWEPWASLMACGAKRNETRGYRVNHVGDIAIHAAKVDHGVPDEIVFDVLEAFQQREFMPKPKNMGCILAVVEIVDCIHTESFQGCELIPPANWLFKKSVYVLTPQEKKFGNYAPDRFAIRTRNLRLLANPVPCRGSQAFGWTVPPDIEAKVRAQL